MIEIVRFYPSCIVSYYANKAVLPVKEPKNPDIIGLQLPNAIDDMGQGFEVKTIRQAFAGAEDFCQRIELFRRRKLNTPDSRHTGEDIDDPSVEIWRRIELSELQQALFERIELEQRAVAIQI
jgi:hypothetical protein